MAVHFEYLDAQRTTADLLTPGTQVEDDVVVPAGEVALALASDAVVVIEGKPGEVSALLEGALADLRAHTSPATSVTEGAPA